MIEDMCAFFRAIERNPEAIVSGLTVRDMLYLRQHIQMCDECYEITNRVNERYKDEKPNLGDFYNEN